MSQIIDINVLKSDTKDLNVLSPDEFDKFMMELSKECEWINDDEVHEQYLRMRGINL